MSDWVYVVGEGSYNQDFIIIDHQTNEQVPLSGVITMFITDSAFQNPIPDANGQPMTIETNDSGVQVARLAVTATKMPTSPGIFMVQIKIDSSQLFKTFFLNLRAIRSITN